MVRLLLEAKANMHVKISRVRPASGYGLVHGGVCGGRCTWSMVKLNAIFVDDVDDVGDDMVEARGGLSG